MPRKITDREREQRRERDQRAAQSRKEVASILKINLEALEKLSPLEREAVEQELLAVERAFAANPLLKYQPHRKQAYFHQLPHPPLRAFFGGNRSGKTTATMVDTIVQAVDWELCPEHLLGVKRWTPPFYCRVVTPDLTGTLDGVVLQKFRDWCPKAQLHGGAMDKAYDKVRRVLQFKNGSRIEFFSNDQDLDKFGGSALHRVVYDEEPREDIRRECLMRLIDYGGEELYGMTPLHGMSWVFDEIYEPWERDALEDGRVVVVDMDDNPHLDRATMQRVLQGLSPEEREARKSGRFVSFSGLIYPQFSTKTHVIPELDPREIPPRAEVFCGIDPGYRHMCAVVFCYLTSEDELVVFDEIAAVGHTVQTVCKQINEKIAHWRRKPAWFVIDPAARNKSGQTGRSDQQEFHDNGIVTIPGQNAVTAGINRLAERLDARRLKVCANCHELRGEFKRYRWVKDRTRVEDQSPEKPVKKDDHLLDALRYVVMQRPLRPLEEQLPETATFKDRMLRKSLERLSRLGKVPDHPSGPGIYA